MMVGCTRLLTLLVAISAPAMALDTPQLHQLYQEQLGAAESGIYPLSDNIVVKNNVARNKGESVAQGRLRARAGAYRLLAQERHKLLQARTENSLHIKLLARKGITASFKGQGLQVDSHCDDNRCTYAFAVDAEMLNPSWTVPGIEDLGTELGELLQGAINQEQYKALSSDFSLLGYDFLADYYALRQVEASGFLKASFPSVNAGWSEARPISEAQATAILSGNSISCSAIEYLATVAKGTIKLSLSRLSESCNPSPVQLPDWYQTEDDFRQLVAQALTGNGYTVFSADNLYGSAKVAAYFQQQADAEFTAGTHAQKAIALQITALSQNPLNQKGWNQLGAVLRAMGELRWALAAHQQAVMVAGPDAETLIHLAKTRQAMNAPGQAQAYIRLIRILSLPGTDSAWVQSSLKHFN
ncbi:hypothetical protein [Spongorhabdus nitratireducens]